MFGGDMGDECDGAEQTNPAVKDGAADVTVGLAHDGRLEAWANSQTSPGDTTSKRKLTASNRMANVLVNGRCVVPAISYAREESLARRRKALEQGRSMMLGENVNVELALDVKGDVASQRRTLQTLRRRRLPHLITPLARQTARGNELTIRKYQRELEEMRTSN